MYKVKKIQKKLSIIKNQKRIVF